LGINGEWHYLYRAIDRDGNLVDVRLSRKRDKAALGEPVKHWTNTAISNKIIATSSNATIPCGVSNHSTRHHDFVARLMGCVIISDHVHVDDNGCHCRQSNACAGIGSPSCAAMVAAHKKIGTTSLLAVQVVPKSGCP